MIIVGQGRAVSLSEFRVDGWLAAATVGEGVAYHCDLPEGTWVCVKAGETPVSFGRVGLIGDSWEIPPLATRFVRVHRDIPLDPAVYTQGQALIEVAAF
ncbi:MAG: hypothetical protein HY397_03560 [Candidatus Doudnabacteria bacterium]|nr:hypothetical protein [Candidatus Doudnabacteria bacterium]